jgi:hypothetical protein
MKLLCAALFAAVSCLALAQPENRELRRDLERFYDRWDRVIETGSVASLRNLLEPDFYQVDKDGNRVTVAGFVDQMARYMRYSSLESNTTVLHVRQGHGEAFAWIQQSMTWGGKTRTMRIAHTLRRTAGGWKVYYSQVLPDNEPWGPPPGK